jgi:hypothetical protein
LNLSTSPVTIKETFHTSYLIPVAGKSPRHKPTHKGDGFNHLSVTGGTMSVQEAFNEHLQALAQQDWDALMAGYSEDIVLITPSATLRGKTAAQELIEQVFGALPDDWQSKFALHKMEVIGDFVYVLWSIPPYFPLYTDTFLYRDGLILTQTATPTAPS